MGDANDGNGLEGGGNEAQKKLSEEAIYHLRSQGWEALRRTRGRVSQVNRTKSARIWSERSLVRNRKDRSWDSLRKDLSDLGNFTSKGECPAVTQDSLGCATGIDHPQTQPLQTTRFISHSLCTSIAIAAGWVLCSVWSSRHAPCRQSVITWNTAVTAAAEEESLAPRSYSSLAHITSTRISLAKAVTNLKSAMTCGSSACLEHE